MDHFIDPIFIDLIFIAVFFHFNGKAVIGLEISLRNAPPQIKSHWGVPLLLYILLMGFYSFFAGLAVFQFFDYEDTAAIWVLALLSLLPAYRLYGKAARRDVKETFQYSYTGTWVVLSAVSTFFNYGFILNLPTVFLYLIYS